jgi:hypothetical protein
MQALINVVSLIKAFLNKKKKKNAVAFSSQGNHTDWGTATGRQFLVLTFVDRGVSLGQRGGTHTAVNLSFLNRSHYFFFQVVPHLMWRGWAYSLLLRKSGSAGNRTWDLWVCSQELWPLDYRCGQTDNYNNSEHYLSPFLLFNTRRFVDWILSPSSGSIYQVKPNR